MSLALALTDEQVAMLRALLHHANLFPPSGKPHHAEWAGELYDLLPSDEFD